MPRQHVSQHARRQSQADLRGLHVADRSRDLYAWIGPSDAIAYLGIGSLSALYRLIREHRLPFGRIGRQYRFRRDHLDQWVTVRGVEAIELVTKRA